MIVSLLKQPLKWTHLMQPAVVTIPLLSAMERRGVGYRHVEFHDHGVVECGLKIVPLEHIVEGSDGSKLLAGPKAARTPSKETRKVATTTTTKRQGEGEDVNAKTDELKGLSFLAALFIFWKIDTVVVE
jgi:hypothetical protein